MADQLREWRKYREQSRRALGPAGMLSGIVTAGLAVAYLLGVRFPLWLWLLILAVVWFQFLGDCLNVFILTRRIAAAERGKGGSD
jgi:hypothetical protein